MAGKEAIRCCLMILVLIFLLQSPASSAVPLQRWKSLGVVKKLNREGPYLGLITTFFAEDNAFIDTGAFKPHPRHPYVDLSGRRFRIGKVMGKKVVYVSCGMGMINAAAATQQMLDLFDVIGIVHFGIAGNVNSSLSIGDVTIPKEFANTGLLDWLKPNGTLPANDVAHLDFGSYNIPSGENLLGHIGYSPEQFFESKKPNTAQDKFWFQINENWLQLASRLEGMELEKCVNSSLCLPHDPKVVVGLRGSTADFFLDNAAYREFLFQNFQVSSADMESAAVVMISLSNGFPVIVIRALSDLSGAEDGENVVDLFGSLAASNAARAVIQFIKTLPMDASLHSAHFNGNAYISK